MSHLIDPRSDRPGDPRHVRAAIRFTVTAAVIAIALLLVGLVFGREAHAVAAIAATLTLLVAGGVCFLRTYRVWRGGGPWYIWQAAGWALELGMLLMLSMSAGVFRNA